MLLPMVDHVLTGAAGEMGQARNTFDPQRTHWLGASSDQGLSRCTSGE